jgi:glyoxylate/hydroxypyruvate reductase A
MSVLVISPGRDPEPWVKALKKESPGINVYAYPEEHDPEEIEYVISWKHPRGIYKHYPNLKVIASMGAGVDHITCDPEIPENIAITRIIDKQLSVDMSDFVLALVMNHIRNISFHHNSHSWKPLPYRRIEEEHIGIMGLGIMGNAVAQNLLKNRFNISGWAKTSKKLVGINTYSGEKQFEKFLNRSTILICLLPLTQETENILNKELFEKLPKGAYIINVARGQHLMEYDLLEMIDNGHLSGASLDVFRIEPLPQEHLFWDHPKINISPHIASITNPHKVVHQIMDNYRRMKEGKKLKNTIVRKLGY